LNLTKATKKSKMTALQVRNVGVKVFDSDFLLFFGALLRATLREPPRAVYSGRPASGGEGFRAQARLAAGRYA
jgi:hypothetical protein